MTNSLTAASRPHGKGWLTPRVAAFILVATVAAAYSNSFQGEFIFDDANSIGENETIQKLWPLTTVLWPPPKGGRTVDGRPLVNLSIAINYQVSGLDVWSYHAFNLLIHITATLLLFGIVRHTLLLSRLHETWHQQSTGLALAVALVWGLHPLQTESVTYIIQRAESMMGMFYLLVLYCTARAEQAQNRFPWCVGAVLACLAGMATKEVMVTAPVVVALYLGVFVFDSWRQLLQERWRYLLALASSWILLAALVIPLGGRGGSAAIDSHNTVLMYVKTQIPVVVYYLKLSLSPSPLVLDYGIRLVVDPKLIISCGVFLLVLIAAALGLLIRRSWAGFLGISFFLILSPSSTVVPVLTQTIAEHRMYLPLAPLACLMVVLTHWGIARLHRRIGPNRMSFSMLSGLLLTVIAIILGTHTWLRNLDYRTAFSIWSDTVKKQPYNDRAHLNLANIYLQMGDLESTLRHANLAVEVNPRARAPYFVRGTLLLQLKEYDKALADLNRAIELSPRFAEAFQHRGVTYRRLGRLDESLADLNRAIKIDPSQAITYRSRALVYSELGRISEARRDAQTFLDRGGQLDQELAQVLKQQ